VGVGIEPEKKEMIEGLSEVRLELAHQAQARGDLGEADVQVNRVLRIDPKNEDAQKFKLDNDKKIAEHAGKQPSKAVVSQLPEIKAEQVKTSILVQDARFLMEMGRLDEAEAKLNQAVKENPEHQAAFYYLTLIKERRFSQEARKREVDVKAKLVEVEREWNTPTTRETLPTPNPFANTNLVYTSPMRMQIFRKLDKIVLDEWFIPGDVPLSEVVKELDTETRKRDPDHRGLNFIISQILERAAPNAFAAGPAQTDPLTGQVIAQAPETPINLEEFTIKIDPPLRGVRLADVLDAIVKVAKPPAGQNQYTALKYSVEDYAIVFSQRLPESEPLYTRTFKVDPNTFVQCWMEFFSPQTHFRDS